MIAQAVLKIDDPDDFAGTKNRRAEHGFKVVFRQVLEHHKPRIARCTGVDCDRLAVLCHPTRNPLPQVYPKRIDEVGVRIL